MSASSERVDLDLAVPETGLIKAAQELMTGLFNPEGGFLNVRSALVTRLYEMVPPEEFMVGGPLAKMIDNELLPFQTDGTHWNDQPLSDEIFAQLYDSRLPTIGLRADFFPSASLYALAAAKLKEEGSAVSNVILLPPGPYSVERLDRRNLFAGRGWMVDANGALYGGEFPGWVPINLVTDQERLLDHRVRGGMAKRTYVVEGTAQATILADKTKADTYLNGAQPKCLAVTGFGPDTKVLVEELLSQHGSLVVKPIKGKAGIGVIVLNQNTSTTDHLLEQLEMAYLPGEELVIEERIPCLPLYDTQFDIHYDWNIRVLAIGGSVVGHYARVGKKDVPINMHQGAVAKSTYDALCMAGISSDEIDSIINKLEDQSNEMAKAVGQVVIGGDVIITPDHEIRWVELNGSNSGGLSNIINTGYDQDKLEPAKKALKLLTSMASLRIRKGRLKQGVPRPQQLDELLIEFVHASFTTENPSAELEYAHKVLSRLGSTALRGNEEVGWFIQWYESTQQYPSAVATTETRVLTVETADRHFKEGARELGSLVLHKLAAAEPYSRNHQARVYRAYPGEPKDILFEDMAGNRAIAAAAAAKLYDYLTEYVGDARHASFAGMVLFRSVLTEVLLKQPQERILFDTGSFREQLSSLPEGDLALLEPSFVFIEALRAIHTEDIETLIQTIDQMNVGDEPDEGALDHLATVISTSRLSLTKKSVANCALNMKLEYLSGALLFYIGGVESGLLDSIKDRLVPSLAEALGITDEQCTKLLQRPRDGYQVRYEGASTQALPISSAAELLLSAIDLYHQGKHTESLGALGRLTSSNNFIRECSELVQISIDGALRYGSE